ncbi:ATP-binding protein [Streptomyces ehimensis]|uniref:ATP-binding protein n=1 Tax=Streptomyces ehimensis TaxID=68195 RepID=A0ABV9BET0_9ACTN
MFGEELRRRREAAGISLRRMATILHVSPGWLSRIEREQHYPPTHLAAAADTHLGAGGALISLAAASDAKAGHLRPAELPSGPAAFVGRSSTLRTLDTLLARAESAGTTLTVALDGPAGAGKSALAIEWAHSVSSRFPGGVLFADLQGFSTTGRAADPRRVLERFLRALGAPPERVTSADLDELAAHFRTIVSHRRTLIILDNARDPRQVRSLLTGPVGSSMVLITSRRRMTGLTVQGAAHRVPVTPMEDDDALALLRSIVGDERVDAEPAAARALVERCAHLPLALRIAAVRLAPHPHRPISGAVRALADDRDRLDALADGGDDLAVRSAFAGSYRELAPEAARAYRLLGLHTGPHISTPAVAALLGHSEPVAQRLLDDLVDFHLLDDISTGSSGRYRFHDLLHTYAGERAAADESPEGREAAITRLTSWYASCVDRANYIIAPQRRIELLPPPPDVAPLDFTDAQQAAAWCDAEAENFVPIVRLAADRRQAAAWQVATRLWNWLLIRKPWTLWEESHTIALKAATSAGDSEAQAWVSMNLGEGYRQSRRYKPAREHAQRARVLRDEIGDRHGQGWCQASLGFLSIDEGAPELALTHFRQALERFRETDDFHGETIVLAALSEAHDLLSAPDEAEDAFQAALSLARRMQDLYAEGILWFRHANAHRHRGDMQAALESLNSSVQCRRSVGDAWGTAEALALRGDVLAQIGDDGAARKSWQQAQDAFEALGDTRAAELRQRLTGDLPSALADQ